MRPVLKPLVDCPARVDLQFRSKANGVTNPHEVRRPESILDGGRAVCPREPPAGGLEDFLS
jgi:hypothetical protein